MANSDSIAPQILKIEQLSFQIFCPILELGLFYGE